MMILNAAIRIVECGMGIHHNEVVIIKSDWKYIYVTDASEHNAPIVRL